MEMCAEYQFNLLAVNSHANHDPCQGTSMAADIVRTGKKGKEPEKQLQRNENVSEEILTFDFFFPKR